MTNGVAPSISYDVIIPTVGRPSLQRLIGSLAAADGPPPQRVFIVDDRRHASEPLDIAATWLVERTTIVASNGNGPAAARNAGWRASTAPWVAFLDDDVVVGRDWRMQLVDDLHAASDAGNAGASQGRIDVPLPQHRRPTDWERNVAGLARARWITADLAVRRSALEAVGGFDERFRRAYREDTDFALRLMRAGFSLVAGSRRTTHPVGRSSPWASVRLQRGNYDDALMDALHGAKWRAMIGERPGRRRFHLLASAALAVMFAAVLLRRRTAAMLWGACWLAATLEFAWARVAPGPRTVREIALMIATSAAIPPAATYHWIAGMFARRGIHAGVARRNLQAIHAVLFDRDGTLVRDLPGNKEAAAVEPRNGTASALQRLRAAGLRLGVISNQSAIAAGTLTIDDVAAVNRAIESKLGAFEAWVICPHAPGDACACRKPAPGMVRRAAALLATTPEACAVVGDIGADVDAARNAGASAVLVPTRETLRHEIDAAPCVAADLERAVDRVLHA